MDSPVPWYKSQRFIALAQSSTITILTWVGICLSANDWSSWRIAAATLIGNIALQLKDWWNPNVVAPIAMANRNNTGTVSPASIADAIKRDAP